MLLLALAHMDFQSVKGVAELPLYHEALSNRLAASVDRIRFLGMIVGEAVSAKVDPENQQLKFKVPETEDPSSESWRSLINIDDELYPLQSLKDGVVEEEMEPPKSEAPRGSPAEEITIDNKDDLDKDLRVYAVPESDTEDSDEDPTLVSREKITAPLFGSRFRL